MNIMVPRAEVVTNMTKRNQYNLAIEKVNAKQNSDEYKQLSINAGFESTKLSINNDIDKYIKPRKQLIMMLMCVIITFYVCLFPLKTWTLILILIGHQPFFLRVVKLRQYWYISIVVRFFFYANSSINPILYNSMSKKFRRAFKSIFIFHLCCADRSAPSITNDECTNANENGYKRSVA